MPTVELVEYQASWPAAFDAVAAQLAAAMRGVDARVEHIGSTSVPGLCAKPVIDVLLGVGALAEVEARVAALGGLGFRYRPEYEDRIRLRRYFVRDAVAAAPRVHLHAVVRDGPLWRDHLAFRDALCADASPRGRYARLKRALASRLDKDAYTEAKAPFVHEVLAAAAAGHRPAAS